MKFEEIGMTDAQFKTYNKLITLIDCMIENCTDEEQKKIYKQEKEDILKQV